MKSMVFVGLLLSINIAFSSYAQHDDCPLCLTGNFSSRKGDIYWVDAIVIEELKQEK